MNKRGFTHVALVVLLFAIVIVGEYLYLNYLDKRNSQVLVNTNPVTNDLQTKLPSTLSPTGLDSGLVLVGPESYKDTDYFLIKGELKKIASISGLIKEEDYSSSYNNFHQDL